jgi:hypothetical protein
MVVIHLVLRPKMAMHLVIEFLMSMLALLVTDTIKVMLLSALWPNSTFDEVAENTAKKMTRDIAFIAEEMGLLQEFQYINYADPSQDPIGSYGSENVEYLRQVSRTYDPEGFWQRQVPGGFKLGLNY